MKVKLIDGNALAERLKADAITQDQIRQANMIAKVIKEMPEYIGKQQLSSIYGEIRKPEGYICGDTGDVCTDCVEKCIYKHSLAEGGAE